MVNFGQLWGGVTTAMHGILAPQRNWPGGAVNTPGPANGGTPLTGEEPTPRKYGPQPGRPGYRAPRPVADRLLERIIVDANGCWIWQGYVNRKGYGAMRVGSRVDGTLRVAQVHRAAYEAFVGPIPNGLHIDHVCENKACANPAHLEPVTNAENKRRAGERATACRRGHPRTAENAYVNPQTGTVQCRVCKREQARKSA